MGNQWVGERILQKRAKATKESRESEYLARRRGTLTPVVGSVLRRRGDERKERMDLGFLVRPGSAEDLPLRGTTEHRLKF